jgi:hypothetical protein
MSYRDYYAPDSWYEPDCEPDYECSHCDEKEKTLDNSKEFLESIVSMLYSKEPLDLLAFENHLDELCSYMDVTIDKGDLQVQRLQEKKIIQNHLPVVDEWKIYNNEYLKNLTHTII